MKLLDNISLEQLRALGIGHGFEDSNARYCVVTDSNGEVIAKVMDSYIYIDGVYFPIHSEDEESYVVDLYGEGYRVVSKEAGYEVVSDLPASVKVSEERTQPKELPVVKIARTDVPKQESKQNAQIRRPKYGQWYSVQDAVLMVAPREYYDTGKWQRAVNTWIQHNPRANRVKPEFIYNTYKKL